MSSMRQDRKSNGVPRAARSTKMNPLAAKRDAALEGVRARMKKNVGAPPIVRSKRNRSANQETRRPGKTLDS